MKKTDIAKFKDFIFSKWKTLNTQKDGNDTILVKEFKIKKFIYYLIARFNNENYIQGYFVDENGGDIVNGKGFSIDSFINLCDNAIKEIKKEQGEQ